MNWYDKIWEYASDNLVNPNYGERVIETVSCSEYLAAGVVSSFIIGDRDDYSEAQREEHLRSCVNAASGTDGPEAAVLDRIICSFDLCPAVVRLV